MKATHFVATLSAAPVFFLCACSGGASGARGTGTGGSGAAPSDGSSGARSGVGSSDSGAGGASEDVGTAGDAGTDDAAGTSSIDAAGSAQPRPDGGVNSAADTAFNAYNTAFLVTSGAKTYYKKSISDGTADGTWVASLDILVAEDAYERTGSSAHKALVNNLCATWLQNTPTPWTWDGWNDDIGWFSLALIRGYQMTGTASFLTAAKYGFDMAWARGWDTQYNGGGIWEQQPDKTPAGQTIDKQALSNDSLGKVASLIYQSTHDQSYLDHATQIYDWVRSHIYNSSDGQIYNGIDRNNTVNTGSAVYNQGTFVDFANMLYEIIGDMKYYGDANRSIDYVKNKMTSNGVISNSAGYLNTWADEFARGLGHFVRDSRQWDAYYPWMEKNAAAIWNERRVDYDITWNGWTQPTPHDNSLTTSKFASAVAWLQFTPTTKPDGVGGVHHLINIQSSAAIDNASQSAEGSGVVQAILNTSQNQKWLLTQNDDLSWNIVSLSSWKALGLPAGSATTSLPALQQAPNRDDNQRWWVDPLADGGYEISNKATGGALDGSSSSASGCSATSGCAIVGSVWNGSNSQHWRLE